MPSHKISCRQLHNFEDSQNTSGNGLPRVQELHRATSVCREQRVRVCEPDRHRNNYKVVAIDNCDDALMQARSNLFDLYLIDNWMSGCSGIDLCKKLREFDSRTPILFYSGAVYERDKQQAFAAGPQGYLVKPVNNDELIEQVSRLTSGVKQPTSMPA